MLGLVIVNSQNTSSNSLSQDKNFQLPNEPSTLPPKPDKISISQTEAVDLIRRWLKAKRDIFGPSYNRYLLSEFLIDKSLECNIGSVNWLEENGQYFLYGTQQIVRVNSFYTQGNQAEITVTVKEDLSRYIVSTGRRQRSFKQRTKSYELQLDDREWKISYYKLPGCYK